MRYRFSRPGIRSARVAEVAQPVGDRRGRTCRSPALQRRRRARWRRCVAPARREWRAARPRPRSAAASTRPARRSSHRRARRRVPPRATCVRTRELRGLRLKKVTDARTRRAMRHQQRIVGVEHDRAIGARDAADDRLDLGQLGQRVQALQVEVIGADVGQHAGVVRLVRQAAQQDAATGRFEDGNLDLGVVA